MKAKKDKIVVKQYTFGGETYVHGAHHHGFNRLPLAVIKAYAANPENDGRDLKAVFNRSEFMPGCGTVKTLDETKAYSDPTKRFWIDDDDLIVRGGDAFAVTNNWSFWEITAFIAYARTLDFVIDEA